MSDPILPGDKPPRRRDRKVSYADHFPRMVNIGVAEGGLERAEAEQLAHEILLGFLVKAGKVADHAMWLDAAMRRASKRYVRRPGGDQ